MQANKVVCLLRPVVSETKPFGSESKVHSNINNKEIKSKIRFEKEQELKYVKDMLLDFPLQFKDKQVATTPASEKIFIGGVGKQLDDKRRKIFHTFVAKCLFLSKRVRPDIQPAIAVLTTRVKALNEANG